MNSIECLDCILTIAQSGEMSKSERSIAGLVAAFLGFVIFSTIYAISPKGSYRLASILVAIGFITLLPPMLVIWGVVPDPFPKNMVLPDAVFAIIFFGGLGCLIFGAGLFVHTINAREKEKKQASRIDKEDNNLE